MTLTIGDTLIDNPSECFYGIEGHEALDINQGPGYDTLLLQLISGDLQIACPKRQFHTVPDFLDSRAVLSKSNLMHECHARKRFVPLL